LKLNTVGLGPSIQSVQIPYIEAEGSGYARYASSYLFPSTTFNLVYEVINRNELKGQAVSQ